MQNLYNHSTLGNSCYNHSSFRTVVSICWASLSMLFNKTWILFLPSICLGRWGWAAKIVETLSNLVHRDKNLWQLSVENNACKHIIMGSPISNNVLGRKFQLNLNKNRNGLPHIQDIRLFNNLNFHCAQPSSNSKSLN